MTNARILFLAALLLIPGSVLGQTWAAQEPPYGRPDAVVDLRTQTGVDLVKGQWKREVIIRYQIQSDRTLSDGKVFFDATGEPGEDAWDGMKVDQNGNLYLSRPRGLWIISPEGKHLGTIVVSRASSQHGLGRRRRQSLYLCAKTGLYRVRLNIPGIRP